MTESRIVVNGRPYRVPAQTVVAVCVDGCEPAYLDAAAGVMPNLARIVAAGQRGLARTVVPSFTNPNNVAIVTGVPPSLNGIPGNYYYDQAADEEVLMNDPAWLRCPTLLAAMAGAGVDVVAVTTKDKLRAFLADGLPRHCVNLSVERAHEATVDGNGIDGVVAMVGRQNPGIYDPEASVYCLELGVRLLERARIPAAPGQPQPPCVMYLSTTDYVQHKFAPHEPEALAFHARLDTFLGQLHDAGVALGITADHGMNDKTLPDGSPRVQYIESLLVAGGVPEARVILPITDPYVVHHGALGSYATVYVDATHVVRAAAVLAEVPGVEAVYTRAQAVERYDLPADRIGDLVVLADRHTVLGRTPEWHDLSDVRQGLRSHGGVHEATVPFIVNRPLLGDVADALAAGRLRNYDLFQVLCNGLQEA